MSDPVNHPDHYTNGEIEFIDAAKSMLTPEEFRGAMKFQILKYTWRERTKENPAQDMEKGRWYLDKLIECLRGVK